MTFLHAAIRIALTLPHTVFAHSSLVADSTLSVPARQEANRPPAPACSEWQECRQLAIDAAARQDYEAFHDLAWRAVQTGPKNDAQLMYLLARAQSLSGRPGDALVMLQRLAAMGVHTDAAASDDFRRVRTLPGWLELSTNPGGTSTGESTPSINRDGRGGATAAAAGVPPTVPRDSSAKPPEPSTPSLAPGVVGSAKPEPIAPPAARPSSSVGSAVETLRFSAPRFTPAGIAYDAVSRRFIVGDRHARKLAVVDEFSQHVANLASAQTSGFGEITALEIDARLGNLWVVSADARQTMLHKLQLVSGRSLASYAVDGSLAPARLVDVAATAQSAVLALDAAGHRLFQLKPKGTSLELAAVLPDAAPASVAPASEAVVYVANAGGIVRVDLASRAAVPVKAAPGIDLNGVSWFRWHQGSLLALQRIGDPATVRVVRFTLDRAGRSATAAVVLDALLPSAEPTAVAVSGDVLFYLTSGEGTEMIVRRIALR
jgi:hypothetical protein